MSYPISYPGGPKTFGQNAFQPQQFFPMPQGNVYTIDNQEEIQSIPCGTGVSVALCLNKNLMYIKSIQGGNPLYWVYNITPVVDNQKEETEDRVTALEKKIDLLLQEVNKNGKSNELAKLVNE